VSQRLGHERFSEVEAFVASDNVFNAPMDAFRGRQRRLIRISIEHVGTPPSGSLYLTRKRSPRWSKNRCNLWRMNEDLSRFHGPVSGLFPRPATAPEWEAYRLSDEQVRFYREHGYLAGIRMLNEEQIEVLRRELAELS